MRRLKRSRGAREVDEAGSTSDNDNYIRDEAGVVRIAGTAAAERPAAHPGTLASEEAARHIPAFLNAIACGRPLDDVQLTGVSGRPFERPAPRVHRKAFSATG